MKFLRKNCSLLVKTKNEEIRWESEIESTNKILESTNNGKNTCY